MARQLKTSDLLVEQNRDGNFFYIVPNGITIPTTNLVADVTRVDASPSIYGDDRGGIVVDENSTTLRNVSIENAKNGIHIDDVDNTFVYDYTFFETNNSDLYAAAVQRSAESTGSLRMLRTHANGMDPQIKDISDYYEINTEFIDNASHTNPAGEGAVYLRDMTARSFADAIIDTKSNVYLMNATLEDAFRVIRVWPNSHVILVNCSVKLGDGTKYGWISGYNARISYYNTLWDGKSTADLSKFATYSVKSADVDWVLQSRITKLTSNPLEGMDPFFAVDRNEYRAQIQVNYDRWIDIALPGGGDFSTFSGDTQVKLPDLGNGVYRIRAWTDGVDGPTAMVYSKVFLVDDAAFDYAGGIAPPQGGSGNDVITGVAYDDIILAGGGNDTVRGGDGDDRLSGGSGSDWLRGEAGEDTLEGDAGNDVLEGGAGQDSLVGADGDDVLRGGDDADTLRGGTGDDILAGGAGIDSIDGGDGFDTVDFSDIAFSSAGYAIDLQAATFRSRASGSTWVETFGGIEGVVGTSSDDVIKGLRLADRIEGGPGDDTLNGDVGADAYLFDNGVDFGADVVTSFQSDDELWFRKWFDPGADDVIFLNGAGVLSVPTPGGVATIDTIHDNKMMRYDGVNSEGWHVFRIDYNSRPEYDIGPRNPGAATPYVRSGGAGADTVSGTSGVDRLSGLGGADLLRGFSGADALHGGDGDDTLDGGDGEDWLNGEDGRDLLIGGAGVDTLQGGDGDDTLRGGDGVDVLLGGGGVDTIDYSDIAFSSAGYAIDLQTATFRSRATGSTWVETFSAIERVVGTSSNDVIVGRYSDRITGGGGNDTLKGGTGADVYVFDNGTDFGNDVLTEFQSDDEIWFTDFVDPGPDKVIFLDGAGRLPVAIPGGLTRTIDTIHDDRMMRYYGENAEGYYVFKIDYASRPAVDAPGVVNVGPPQPTLTVRAGGSGGPSAGPEFVVKVNGAVVGSVEIAEAQTAAEIQASGVAYESYVFAYAASAGAPSVEIAYVNDGRDAATGEDRNLYVDWVELGGVRLESEVDGRFEHWNDLTSVEGPREALYWSGSLFF